MKQIILALMFSAFVVALYGQRFELRVIDRGELAYVQIRNVSEQALRSAENRVTDLVFGVQWRDSGINFLEIMPGGSYKMVPSGIVKQHNGYWFQAFGGMQTPYLMPSDWKKNEWVDLVVFKVHGASQTPKGGTRFSLAQTGFDVTTDPNVGIDLVDETPKIVGYHVQDDGPVPYATQEQIGLDVVKYGPRDAHLTWTVGDPESAKGYIVERRVGDGDWEELADLSSEGQYVHVYVDENVYDGVARQEAVGYRVRMLTQVGEMMSEEKMLDFSAQKMISSVYPNPAADKVSVKMTATPTDGDAYLEIYNSDAKLVYQRKILPGSELEQIDLAANNVTSGSFSVNLVSEGKILDAHPLHVMR